MTSEEQKGPAIPGEKKPGLGPRAEETSPAQESEPGYRWQPSLWVSLTRSILPWMIPAFVSFDLPEFLYQFQ